MIREVCCEQCWHSAAKPCHQVVDCLEKGPLCHESVVGSRLSVVGSDEPGCVAKRENLRHAHLRDAVARPTIYIGAGTCGLGAGAAKTKLALKTLVPDAEIIEVGCVGLCAAEPIVDVQLPGGPRVSYGKVNQRQVPVFWKSITEHTPLPPGIQRLGTVSPDYRQPATDNRLQDHPFFAPQLRWVLENCGVINPRSIEDALVRGAYRALANVIGTKTREQVVDIVEHSGLRGRGGGGFPTGKKWRIALANESEQKYFICNADEGDPGAFMDRAVIEGDPHRVLEGLIIGAYAIGASVAYIYIRAEYPLAIAHLEEAIAQARAWGFIGENILDSGFSIDVKIKMGAGAFVCGEETALIHSIEGKRGMPRPRPPYPAIRGLFGKPTIINNVETLANLPKILEHGAEWFSSVGTNTSKGTKVFALSGKVRNTGLIEVAMGTKIRDIIFAIGGGVPDDKEFKAAQMGGPSGGCVATQHLDLEIDYESLKSVGAMMGSGGLVVMDEETCMVDVARFFMEFIQRESCGKCVSCREGTRQLLETFRRINTSRRRESGFDALTRMQGVMNLQQLAEVIRETSLCGLGQSAPNPVLSTMRWFMDEYEEHIYDRHCRAHACRELLTYTINGTTCKGCTLCLKKCPSDAIRGTLRAPHYIIQEKCISCGSCADVCKSGSVQVA